MTSLAEAPAQVTRSEPAPSPPSSGARHGSSFVLALALAAAFVALPFVAGGGVDDTVASAGNTWLNMAVTVVGGAIIAAGILAGRPGRRWGLVTVGLMAALTALEAVSIAWSVTPDASWLGASQMLAYLMAFGAAATVARAAPARWPLVIGALALATATACAWSLIVKVFPATLAANNQTGRLQAPFGYWNGIGLAGAVGLPCWLWVGARRGHARWLAALAAPALTVALAVLVLSYSRSADLAAIVAAGLWLIFVPLRLRAVVFAAVGAVGAAALSAWVLTHGALSHDHVTPAAQDHAGHVFGIVLVVVLVAELAAGIVVMRAMDRAQVSARARRGWGAALLGLTALIAVGAVAALAASSRGLGGQISHGWHELTSTTAVTADNAGRVFQFGSSRPIYWHEALRVGDHNAFKGAGELGFATARLRYGISPLPVHEAHSYVFETYADLGALGLALTAALLIAWLGATRRAVGLGVRSRWLSPEQRAERLALISLAAAVVGFGVQSTLDYTWFFAGIAIPVLVCAGWLAGRGPLRTRADAIDSAALARRRSLLDRPGAAFAATLVVAVAVLGAWMQWQPWRSQQQVTRAENASNGTTAFAAARSAANLNPFSLEPHNVLSALDESAHQRAAARRELVTATQKQPDNPASWLSLAQFDHSAGRLTLAITDSEHALNLDHTPGDPTALAATNILKHAQVTLIQRRQAAAG